MGHSAALAAVMGAFQGMPMALMYAIRGDPYMYVPSYMFTAECQQLVINVGALRSVHPAATEKPGRKPFRDIKVMKDDPAGVEKAAEEIKARYSKTFGV